MFPFPTPKTATEALRQCHIHARAMAMLTDPQYVLYRCAYGKFGVYRRSYTSAPDTGYTVSLHPLRCNCPDYESKGYFCKHLVFLWTVLEREAEQGLCDYPADIVACLQHEMESYGESAIYSDRADRLVREAGGGF